VDVLELSGATTVIPAGTLLPSSAVLLMLGSLEQRNTFAEMFEARPLVRS
jgi:hypothetical protein